MPVDHYLLHICNRGNSIHLFPVRLQRACPGSFNSRGVHPAGIEIGNFLFDVRRGGEDALKFRQDGTGAEKGAPAGGIIIASAATIMAALYAIFGLQDAVITPRF